MIHGFRAVDELVYHYTSSDIALNHVLSAGTIRLGAYEQTNDPQETRSWVFALATSGPQDLGSYAFEETSQTFSALLKQTTKLACFSTDSGPLTGDHVSDILNRGFAKPRMWAQYGLSHTGVCIVLNKAKLLNAVAEQFPERLTISGPISYKNSPSLGLSSEYVLDMHQWETLGSSAYAKKFIGLYHKPLFFQKLRDWRDECEWRIVLWLDTPEPAYLNIESALVGVIHGANIDIDTSIKIAESTDDAKVTHMGLTWKNNSPWYQYEAMRWSASDRRSPWSKHAR